MINRVILVGRITKDPELKTTYNGTYVVNFILAVNRIVSASSEKTDFIPCTVFGKQAENLSKYISKGNLLGVEGSIKINNWEKADGTTAWRFDVICIIIQFLESKKNTEFF
ncbi:MAG: single-stranded DNA-binding protein [Candidatus Phytoplasma sp. TWB_XP]